MEVLQMRAYIFAELFALANRVQALGDKVDPGLSIKQWLLIAAISNSGKGAPTITEIAKTIGTSHQNVKKMALILEKRGFISFTNDEKDARIVRVVVTDKCEEYFRLHEQEELKFLEKLFSGFSDEQLQGLYNGMKKLVENVTIMEDNND